MKFDMMTHIGPLQRIDCYNYEFLKIQDGDSRNLENHKNRDISTAVWLIFTKFGTLMQNGSLNRPTVKISNFTNPKMGDGGHFKNRQIAISLQPFGRFWWNLAWCRYSGQVVKISNFWKFKMVAAAMLKITKIAISPQRLDLGMLKVENFFSRYQKFFSRDSTRILDHVMIMSHPWRHLT